VSQSWTPAPGHLQGVRATGMSITLADLHRPALPLRRRMALGHRASAGQSSLAATGKLLGRCAECARKRDGPHRSATSVAALRRGIRRSHAREERGGAAQSGIWSEQVGHRESRSQCPTRASLRWLSWVSDGRPPGRLAPVSLRSDLRAGSQGDCSAASQGLSGADATAMATSVSESRSDRCGGKECRKPPCDEVQALVLEASPALRVLATPNGGSCLVR
jgi:hypothetical protein